MVATRWNKILHQNKERIRSAVTSVGALDSRVGAIERLSDQMHVAAAETLEKPRTEFVAADFEIAELNCLRAFRAIQSNSAASSPMAWTCWATVSGNRGTFNFWKAHPPKQPHGADSNAIKTSAGGVRRLTNNL